MNKRAPLHTTGVFVGMGAALLVLALLSLSLGAVEIPLSQQWAILTGGGADESTRSILLLVRWPRVAGAALTGAALAVAGCLLQRVMGNPLAGPNILGVNAGSGLCVLVLSAFFPQLTALSPAAAFLGALAAAMGVYALASRFGAERMTLVLAGVAVSSILGAMTDTLLTLYPQVQAGRVDFMIGGFSALSWERVSPCILPVILGMLVAWVLSYDLNVLALGEETAHALGMRVKLLRFVFILLAAVLAGCAVSMAGLVGFIGLITPHAVRFLTGSDARRQIPLCALTGAAFTLACDLISRLLFAPYELPVGIVMSALGGPFFLWLLFRRREARP